MSTEKTAMMAGLVRESGELLRLARQMRVPARGWLRMLREARGVSQEALATRLGCKRQAWAQFELSEERGAISLYSLKRAAEALEGELVYFIVPKGGDAPLPRAAEGGRRRKQGAGIRGGHEAPVGNTGTPPRWETEELPNELK